MNITVGSVQLCTVGGVLYIHGYALGLCRYQNWLRPLVVSVLRDCLSLSHTLESYCNEDSEPVLYHNASHMHIPVSPRHLAT